MKIKFILALIAVLFFGFTFTSKVNAKDSEINATFGSCPTEFFSDGIDIVYPLPFASENVAVIMKMVGGIPALQSVCVEIGWTVQSKKVTGGVQLTMFKNGNKAIDFKYVLGKTDIRYY